MIDNNEEREMSEQMQRHSAAANIHIRKELNHLAATDPKAALAVSRSMMDIAGGLSERAVPPDAYTAKALVIIAESILYADKEVGVPDACAKVRELTEQYAQSTKQVDGDDDPWKDEDVA